MIKGPCKDCPNRKPACHGHCDIFAEYRSKVDKEREARRLFMLESYGTTYHSKSARKTFPIMEDSFRKRKDESND